MSDGRTWEEILADATPRTPESPEQLAAARAHVRALQADHLARERAARDAAEGRVPRSTPTPQRMAVAMLRGNAARRRAARRWMGQCLIRRVFVTVRRPLQLALKLRRHRADVTARWPHTRPDHRERPPGERRHRDVVTAVAAPRPGPLAALGVAAATPSPLSS